MEGTTGLRIEDAVLRASTARATHLSGPEAGRLQEIAALLLPDVDALADEVSRRALAAEPALADPDDPIWMDEVRQSTRANVGAILAMLTYGVPGDSVAPADGAIKLFERLAERDDGLAIVLRGYRLGIMELWQMWAEHLAGHVVSAEELHTLQAASTGFMLTYVDRISVQLCDQWSATRRRRRQGLRPAPEELIHEALVGAPADADLSALDYPLSATHFAIAAAPTLDDAVIAQTLSALRVESSGHAVSLRLDEAWLIWLALPGPLDRAARARLIGRLEALPGAVGVGQLAAGVEGFRSTRTEALDARRVGLLRDDEGVTLHRDVALLAVLCADTDRARALVRTELGPLAADEDSAERLRETLRAYLAGGESHVAAAHVLHVHQKTVAYRVRQAEALLGRTVSERRPELEAALLLHRAFDGAV